MTGAGRHESNEITITTDSRSPAHVAPFGDGGPPHPIAMAIRVSPEEEAFIDAARRRSYELAIQRGHIRR